MEMPTGFEADQQRIATEQVKVTNRLVAAIGRLCDILESKEKEKESKESKEVET